MLLVVVDMLLRRWVVLMKARVWLLAGEGERVAAEG